MDAPTTTPSLAAEELQRIADGVRDIAGDIERGMVRKDDDGFRLGDEGWVTHLCMQLAISEVALHQVRLDIVCALIESKEGGP